MITEAQLVSPNPQPLHRVILRRLVFGMILLALIPILCVSGILVMDHCDVVTTWYRAIEDKLPLLPVPPQAQLLSERRPDGRPDYGMATVAGWYEEEFAIDAAPETVVAFYRQRGDTCTLRDGVYLIGGFSLELGVPYWHCDVAAEPWGNGNVDILPAAAYAAALGAIYNNPPANLMVPVSQSVIGGRLRLLYGQIPPLNQPVSLKQTIILNDIRWCEPF